MSKVLIRSLRELEDRLKDSLVTSRSETWSGERLAQSKPSSFFKPSPAKPPAAPSHQFFLRQVQAQIEEIDSELHPHSLSFSSIPATPEPLPPADSPVSPSLPEPVSCLQDQEEIKSLKNKLKEALKTIKLLESQIKFGQKDELNAQSRSFSDSKSHSRSKEASFRRLMEEKDLQIREERKTIARVQSLNRVLLEKLKEVQEQQGDMEELRTKLGKSKRKGKEIRRMREIQASLEEEIRGKDEEMREMEEKYVKLRRAAEEFVEKTEGMYEITRRLVEGVHRTSS